MRTLAEDLATLDLPGTYCRDREDWCHASGAQNFAKITGRYDPGPNYGLPHVAGWQSWNDGYESYATNCIYCGKRVI